jgi:hypothetical protein
MVEKRTPKSPKVSFSKETSRVAQQITLMSTSGEQSRALAGTRDPPSPTMSSLSIFSEDEGQYLP